MHRVLVLCTNYFLTKKKKVWAFHKELFLNIFISNSSRRKLFKHTIKTLKISKIKKIYEKCSLLSPDRSLQSWKSAPIQWTLKRINCYFSGRHWSRVVIRVMVEGHSPPTPLINGDLKNGEIMELEEQGSGLNRRVWPGESSGMACIPVTCR